MSCYTADAFLWHRRQASFMVFVGVLVTTKVAYGAPHPRLRYSSRDAERHQPAMFENLQQASIPAEIRLLQIPGQVISSASDSGAILSQLKVTDISTRSAEALDDRQRQQVEGIRKGPSRSADKTRAPSLRPLIHSKFRHASQLFQDDNPIPPKILLKELHSGPRKNRASERPQLTRANFVTSHRFDSPARPSARLQDSSRPTEAHQWIRLPPSGSLRKPILREQASESPFALKSLLLRVSPLSSSRTLYGLLAVGGVFIVGAVIGAVIIVARRNEASADTNFEASPSSSSNLSAGDARQERHPAACERSEGSRQKSEAARAQVPNHHHVHDDEDTPKVVSMGDILGNNSAFVPRTKYCTGADQSQSTSKPSDRPPQTVIRKTSLSTNVASDSKRGESADDAELGGGSKRQAVKQRLLTLTKPKAPETPGASKAAWFATPKATADIRPEFAGDIGGGGSSKNESKV